MNKLKVLWLCNTPLPDGIKAFNFTHTNGGGWLSALAENIKNEVDLYVSFPFRGKKRNEYKKINDITHISVPRHKHSLFVYDPSMDKYFKEIVEKIQPDIIHIQGTENTPACSLVRACPNKKYVVSLQGIISALAVHNHSCLPYKNQIANTPFELLSGHSPLKMTEKYIKSQIYEKEVIKKASVILGRTEFDKAWASLINPNAKYISVPRILRSDFFEKQWEISKCEKKTIFHSGIFPLKGLHFVLKAVNIIKEFYPNVHLNVVGNINKSIKSEGYDYYINNLIKEYNLDKNITFLGNLNAKEMRDNMLKSHVFVMASCCDNSPNTLAEAMILGLPCVASFVGGIPSMLKDKEEGFLYQHDAYYMMAYYIMEIFKNDDLALKFSKNARKCGIERNMPKNSIDILNIYNNLN